MKWEKKGHELDVYRDLFSQKDILLYGAGNVGESFFNESKLLQNHIKGWIDRTGDIKCSLPVYKFTDLTEEIIHLHIIIISANEPNATLFAMQLQRIGLKENFDFFRYTEWKNKYCYLYQFYRDNKVMASFCGIQISNVCNLDCKGCLSWTHYVEKPCFYGYNYLIEQTDILFDKIDYIEMLEICGGEPFLIPDVAKLYEYVGERYRNRIGILSTVTNGSVYPSDDLCRTLEKYRIKVYVDDYRVNVEKVRNSFEGVLEKLLKANVDAEIRKVDNWIDLGILENVDDNEIKSILRHEECCNDRLSLRNGKLFGCDYECFADMAGVYKASENDFLNLYGESMSRAEVLEFIVGYRKNGYISMCSRCNGEGKINTKYIKVAEQNDRK